MFLWIWKIENFFVLRVTLCHLKTKNVLLVQREVFAVENHMWFELWTNSGELPPKERRMLEFSFNMKVFLMRLTPCTMCITHCVLHKLAAIEPMTLPKTYLNSNWPFLYPNRCASFVLELAIKEPTMSSRWVRTEATTRDQPGKTPPDKLPGAKNCFNRAF